MNTVTFTNDLNKEVSMSVEEFKQATIEAVEFVVSEKSYNLNDLTVDFIAEDISGIVKSFHNIEHNISENGLEIIKNTLKEMKARCKVVITRPINGITLNSQEVLLDKDSNPMEFESQENAIQFLLDNGFKMDDMEQFNFKNI